MNDQEAKIITQMLKEQLTEHKKTNKEEHHDIMEEVKAGKVEIEKNGDKITSLRIMFAGSELTGKNILKIQLLISSILGAIAIWMGSK